MKIVLTKTKKIVLTIVLSLIVLLSAGGVLYLCGVFTPDNTPPPTPTLEDDVASKFYYFGGANFTNRIYTVGSDLTGDEAITVYFKDKTKTQVSLTKKYITNFDTSTVGKKVAEIKIGNQTTYATYYVANSIHTTAFNSVVQVNNFFPTYYVNEMLDLTDVSLSVCENKNGKMVTTLVPVTSSMISGFTNNNVGTRKLKITYNDYEFDVTYNIKNISSENVTANSFEKGTYFPFETTFSTTYFNMEIAAGVYLTPNYLNYIETIYETMEEVSGLDFKEKVTVKLLAGNGAGGGPYVIINHNDFILSPGGAFSHELAHCLDKQYSNAFLPTKTLSEGFATYVEFLTVQRIKETHYDLYAITGLVDSVEEDVNQLGDKMYLYDFEEKLLHLDRDELVGNSQYEVGSRFFSYLDHRYGDFCGWMNEYDLNVGSSDERETLDGWKEAIKEYYNNPEVISEFYDYQRSFGNRLQTFCTYTEVLTYDDFVDSDMTGITKYNFHFNLAYVPQAQGRFYVIYKDLYVNLESARAMLNSQHIQYSDIALKVNSNTIIEFYDVNNNIIKTINSTPSPVSLGGVSYIKLVGSGYAKLEFIY